MSRLYTSKGYYVHETSNCRIDSADGEELFDNDGLIGPMVDVLEALGIDGATPLATLRERLAAGERVEQCEFQWPDYSWVRTSDGPRYTPGDLLAWLRGEQTPQ